MCANYLLDFVEDVSAKDENFFMKFNYLPESELKMKSPPVSQKQIDPSATSGIAWII